MALDARFLLPLSPVPQHQILSMASGLAILSFKTGVLREQSFETFI
jgi:hypothetical protein